jgi:DNA-directed RNA polymerase subunit RPC12/RpoP
MVFRVSCDNCGKSLKAREEFVGKKVRCPQCGHRLVVRKPSGMLDDTEDVGLAPIDEQEERELLERERAVDQEFENVETYDLADTDSGEHRSFKRKQTRRPETGAERAGIPVKDPFNLPFPELTEDRTADWLAKNAPEFKELVRLQDDPSAKKQCLWLADNLVQMYPDLGICYEWVVRLRLEAGMIEPAEDMLKNGMRLCKRKAGLYDYASRAAVQRKNLGGVLGWSIRSIIASRHHGEQPSSQVQLHVAEIASGFGMNELASRLRAACSTRLPPMYLDSLASLCAEEPERGGKRAEQHLQRFAKEIKS